MSRRETTTQYVAQPGSNNVAWKGIQDLWQGKLLCDVSLVAGGRLFEAHRCYLASCSSYFNSMFTGAFREGNEKEVKLQGVSGKGLEDVLAYMYTGKIELNQDNIKDILDVSSHLEVTDIQKFCEDYLKNYLSAKTCVQFYNLAEMYSLQDTKAAINSYLRDNFSNVAQTEEFSSLPFEVLCELLESDSLNTESELVVFRSAIYWLSHDPERLCFAEKVLQLVRYGLMTSQEMKEVYDPCGIMMQHEACRKLLKRALDYNMNEYEQPLFPATLSSPRNYVDSLIVYGGSPLQSESLLAAQMHPTITKKFSYFGKLRDVTFGAQVAVINNFLFVVGGETVASTTGENAANSAFRYNPRDGKWLQLSPMATARTWFALIASSGYLYAVCGFNKDSTELSSVEKYDVRGNSWSQVRNLIPGVRFHAGCEYRGKVFITGGLPFIRLMRSYDPETNDWKTHADMNIGRAGHNMVSAGDKLFVFGGGYNTSASLDAALQAEAYNPDTDQWTVLSSSLFGHKLAGCVIHSSGVYIIGGYSTLTKRSLDAIQHYNIKTNEWSVLETALPVPLHGPAAAYLKLPSHVYSSNGNTP